MFKILESSLIQFLEQKLDDLLYIQSCSYFRIHLLKDPIVNFDWMLVSIRMKKMDESFYTRLEIKGLQVRSSPEALCCILEHDASSTGSTAEVPS